MPGLFPIPCPQYRLSIIPRYIQIYLVSIKFPTRNKIELVGCSGAPGGGRHEGIANPAKIRDYDQVFCISWTGKKVSENANPGANLKQLRTQRGWTLADVSERTGFPISTLSKIEKGQVSLSYDKLARISKGLDIDFVVFFAGADAALLKPGLGGRRSIIRKGEGRTIETHSYENRFLATDLLNKRFVPILGQGFVTSIENFGEMIRHQGEEFCYVLEGALELHTEAYAPVRLEAGDAIYFDSGMGHAYISVGDSPCKVLCICSGDESKLIHSLETVEGSGEAQGKPSQAAKRGRKKAAGSDTSKRSV